MPPIIFILLLVLVRPFQVTLQVCSGSETVVYPGEDTEYVPDSCQCLKKISVCAQDLKIRFKDLTLGETLYYEFSEPLYVQEYESLPTTEVSSSIGIAFKGIGTEKQLYFEYLNQSVELHFSFVNQTVEQNNTFPEPFNASYIILSVVVSFLVLFLSNYARIHRFDALSVQWWFAFVYAGLFLAYILILDFTNGRAIKYTQYILAGGLSVVSVFFLAGEFAYSAGLKHKVCKINVRDIFGLLVVGGFVVWRVESGNTWYINDLLNISIVWSVLKTFCMRSFRASYFFLGITSVVHIGLELGYLIKHSRLGLKLINQYPSPFELQIPTLVYFATRRCAWVEISDLILPSLVVNYCRRLDASLGISVYSIVATTCVFLALALQICTHVASSYTVELSQSVFSVPLLLLGLFVVSSRRGEWSMVWYGGFHDKMSQRVSLAKSVEWESLTKDMEKNLMLN